MIIDKVTGKFLRFGLAQNENETEINVKIPDGIHIVYGECPVWNGAKWVETIPLPEPHPQEPTESERIEALEQALLEIVLGGVF